MTFGSSSYFTGLVVLTGRDVIRFGGNRIYNDPIDDIWLSGTCTSWLLVDFFLADFEPVETLEEFAREAPSAFWI